MTATIIESIIHEKWIIAFEISGHLLVVSGIGESISIVGSWSCLIIETKFVIYLVATKGNTNLGEINSCVCPRIFSNQIYGIHRSHSYYIRNRFNVPPATLLSVIHLELLVLK